MLSNFKNIEYRIKRKDFMDIWRAVCHFDEGKIALEYLIFEIKKIKNV